MVQGAGSTEWPIATKNQFSCQTLVARLVLAPPPPRLISPFAPQFPCFSRTGGFGGSWFRCPQVAMVITTPRTPSDEAGYPNLTPARGAWNSILSLRPTPSGEAPPFGLVALCYALVMV